MNRKKWSASLISDIVDSIKDQEGNRIIPIVGQGVYQVSDGGRVYSIQQFVIKTVLENEKIPVQPTEDNIERYANGYRGMTELAKLCAENGLTLLRQIKEIFTSRDNVAKISMDPDVLTFLERGDFPLILTTCNFRWLEQHVTWRGTDYVVVPYRTGKDQDIRTADGRMAEPTIFHLFGYVGQDRNVVITENDFLRYLHCIQDTNTRPERLKKYLENKYILSLGCEIPDWTFRFLLYSLKEKEGKLGGMSGEDMFDGGALSKEMDDELYSFLSDISYFPSHNINEFLRDVNLQLEPERKPTLFLSANSEDYDLAERVKRILSPRFDVWFFRDNGGVQYWKVIEDGISRCDYFVPLTTSTTIEKMLSDKARPDNSEGGVIKELRMALRHKTEHLGGQKYCFPLLHGVNIGLLMSALDMGKCPDLKPLFFAAEGNEHIDMPLEELTAEKVFKHIMS
ncbi:MAG: toll/interleukin-1 receptor domain-containing protein [Prevotella sp.]|nr:toll/interleukin-1 receptor domain-containing protein [Prevotella sp.]